MEIDAILRECNERMDKSVDYFGRELRGIRTGRASTALIEYIKIDYYGSNTDLRDIAAISVPEPTQLMVKPFDPTSKNAIVKAVESADLGLNPMSDGNVIRISIPPPSQERRQQLVGQVRKMAEDTRVAVRNERRDANKKIDQLAADKEAHLPEDHAKSAKSDVDELTKKHTAQIDTICDKKVVEIEEI